MRALEVCERTGVPIPQLQKKRKGMVQDYDVKIFGLNMNRLKLYERIDKRVDKMFKLGLLKEVKKLLKLRLSKTASQSIGIKELKGYLAGEYSLDDARQLMKQNSRRYAKR